ncbi:hypothetical protein B0H67DRAFT_571272 [Lasiosphaeris hirsuta]|uniref:Uncharacterized protein n=1 Tax=Lasiosphaeris hirsuta TaxID=260670 RepID=A0AA40B124_9PEZI|nr:hypothetical protein B0H67DRAFT_571272 [Lasiosphaeris hirsuta]
MSWHRCTAERTTVSPLSAEVGVPCAAQCVEVPLSFLFGGGGLIAGWLAYDLHVGFSGLAFLAVRRNTGTEGWRGSCLGQGAGSVGRGPEEAKPGRRSGAAGWIPMGSYWVCLD